MTEQMIFERLNDSAIFSTMILSLSEERQLRMISRIGTASSTYA